LADPTEDGDAVNKNILDREIQTKILNTSSCGVTKILNMNNKTIINVPDPQNDDLQLIFKFNSEIEVNSQLESLKYLRLTVMVKNKWLQTLK